MLATIAPGSCKATLTARHRRRTAGTRPITRGEAAFIRRLLEARNSIPVTTSEIYVTQSIHAFAPMGHPHIAARLADLGLAQVSCWSRYDMMGDLVIEGRAHVTLAGRKALRTGRVPLV